MGKYAKAFVACAIAFGGALLVALDDDKVSTAEWVKAVLAALGALGITYAVPNSPMVNRRD